MEIQNLSPNNEDGVISKAVTVLKAGGLVVVPTDTVYGCAVDATQDIAVHKLVSFKSRPRGKPISVFVSSLDEAEMYVAVDEEQKAMLSTVLPGPYTIVLPSRGKVCSDLESEHHTLGIRLPVYPFIQRLCEAYGKPITATSANLAGNSPHASVQALLATLSEKKKAMVDLVIDAGQLPVRRPSTVIDMTGGSFKVLRQGDKGLDWVQKGEKLTSHSEQETQSYARALLEKSRSYLSSGPLVFMLYGEVGAGKTVFAKGLGRALGIDNIVSPTYTIVDEYKLKSTYANALYHLDLYRLRDVDELQHLGLYEMLQPGNVVCIEWSEKSLELQKMFPPGAHVIHVYVSDVSDTSRLLSISHADN